MNYTVVWKQAAEDELAELWMAASNRQLFAEAAERLEQSLRTHPWEVGESRNDKTRVVFAGALGIFYEVSDDDRLVTVIRAVAPKVP